MTQKDELGAKIGQAWRAHYGGQNDAALKDFLQLAEQYPDHVDVLWGLGLTYRKIGDLDNALQAFQKVRELVDLEVDPTSENYERFFMLKRMVAQQIAQVDQFL